MDEETPLYQNMLDSTVFPPPPPAKKVSTEKGREYRNRAKNKLSPEEYKLKTKQWRERLNGPKRQYLREQKDVPCTDCGVKYPHFVMEFDHVRGYKLFQLSKYASWNLSQIKEEMSKCEVVCANCHAARTWNRLKTKIV